ncbi:MAG: methyltransferase, TIGR04325 family [Deltaproteobacteria bacterium]|mgnify:FL=1|nr:methyltransferase, TIGR04325 family [Deltaproteobacteria bacterium]
MIQKFKTLAYDWLPPAILRQIRRRRSADIRFEEEYATWKDATENCTGYDSEGILEKVLEATLKVKNGEAVYERDSVLFDHIEYSWPVLSGLMWVAARNNGRLNVLDYGGSLGTSYFQNRKFIEPLEQIRWNVVEQSHYVEAGQTHIQDHQLHFFKTIEECLVENEPNVILLSSVLQYLEDPLYLIKKFSASKTTCLIIDRTPFSSFDVDRLLVQKVSEPIYSASYPIWIFSMSKFLQILEPDWFLIAQCQSPEGSVNSTNGFEFSFQSILLELR